MQTRFSHEKLNVYQESIKFVILIDDTLKLLTKSQPVRDQLERAATSIPLNIAEGNGKSTSKDKCRFLDIARGSAMECAACLDILHAKDVISREKLDQYKACLDEIVSMLVGLIRATSKTRRF